MRNLKMRVSVEKRRSLEGMYTQRSSERYCGPVPVSALKQSVEKKANKKSSGTVTMGIQANQDQATN